MCIAMLPLAKTYVFGDAIGREFECQMFYVLICI